MVLHNISFKKNLKILKEAGGGGGGIFPTGDKDKKYSKSL